MSEARSVLAIRGLDADQHSSREISAELIGGSNLVLTMESSHKEALIAEFPQYTNRIYMLSEMTGMKISVPDPIGGPIIEFEATAQEIEKMLEDGYAKILSLA